MDELKQKHRAMWAQGDYASIADEVVEPLGSRLVRACGVRSGQRVLDVAAGTGNAAIPAALAGADVVASDLTPELLDIGRKQAEQRGADLEWRVADAEALPFADAEFDVVLSCIGVMFAPDHRASADELVRVCRPGGRIGVLSWTPEGFVGQLFATMKPYAPPPPPGAQPAPMWGSPDHVRALFGDRVTDFAARREQLHVSRFGGPEEFREYFKTRYGPTISAYRLHADDPERTAALDADLDDLARRYGHGPSGAELDWEYVITTACRAG